MRISDWSSDVCSSDLSSAENVQGHLRRVRQVPGSCPPCDCTKAFCHNCETDHTRAGHDPHVHRKAEVQADCPKGDFGRPDERRVGKEGASTCRSRWPPYHKQTKDTNKPPTTHP